MTKHFLQEGSRYNALHVSAKALNAEMCNLILTTVGNPAFVQTLYGLDADAECCKVRILHEMIKCTGSFLTDFEKEGSSHNFFVFLKSFLFMFSMIVFYSRAGSSSLVSY